MNESKGSHKVRAREERSVALKEKNGGRAILFFVYFAASTNQSRFTSLLRFSINSCRSSNFSTRQRCRASPLSSFSLSRSAAPPRRLLRVRRAGGRGGGERASVRASERASGGEKKNRGDGREARGKKKNLHCETKLTTTTTKKHQNESTKQSPLEQCRQLPRRRRSRSRSQSARARRLLLRPGTSRLSPPAARSSTRSRSWP
jgi:hypothetical protein